MQLVEVAIVVPILLLLILASAEFGRFFYYYSTLSKATRAAAGYMSSKPYTQASMDKAANLALCGSFTCAAGSEVLPGLQATNFDITPHLPEAGNIPPTVTVTVINYQYQTVFGLGQMIGASWTSFDIGASTTMRYLLTN
ncbi:MAG: TadE family protein [Blastocatellia bacterium]